jgi:hypothetical protein
LGGALRWRHDATIRLLAEGAQRVVGRDGTRGGDGRVRKRDAQCGVYRRRWRECCERRQGERQKTERTCMQHFRVYLHQSAMSHVDLIFHTASIAFGTTFMPARLRLSGVHQRCRVVELSSLQRPGDLVRTEDDAGRRCLRADKLE